MTTVKWHAVDFVRSKQGICELTTGLKGILLGLLQGKLNIKVQSLNLDHLRFSNSNF